jgi:hypothetical protein
MESSFDSDEEVIALLGWFLQPGSATVSPEGAMDMQKITDKCP